MALMRYSERPNNTAEQVREYIGGALDLVEELEPPDDLRLAAFNHAVSLLSSKQVVAEQVGAMVSGTH